jgi:uncharacterized protein YbaR (Trm112 family)
MKRALIEQLQCPYCGGGFVVSTEVEGDAERLIYGLLRCRCFEFPVVDGILMLSLVKDFRGPKDDLDAYVPLQVAAITYLQKKDAVSLRTWIRRHLPLAAELMEGTRVEPYLSLCARLDALFRPATEQYLRDIGRYEILGRPADKASPWQQLRSSAALLRRTMRRAPAVPADVSRKAELACLQGDDASRFYSPRTNTLSLRMGTLPWQGHVLSLRCGHGVFENLLRTLQLQPERVSVDDNLLDLLITRRYADNSGSFVLHELRYPLPFRDGAFDGVFSSNCLPKIPTQKTFVEQAIRVAAPSGWTFFDGISNLGSASMRVDPDRAGGFCQNFFQRLEDYVSLFRECAGPQRQVGIDVPRPTAEYRDSGRWMFESGEIDERLRAHEAAELSALVVDPRHFRGFVPAAPLGAMAPARLGISPAFEPAERRTDELRFHRRSQFARLNAALASRHFAGYPERLSFKLAQVRDPSFLFEQFCVGNLVFLPQSFDRESATLVGK